MDFSPEHLLTILGRLPKPSRYWVGFSGGMDSTVLLHTLSRIRDSLDSPLFALHVDHGLNPHSADWSRQCEQTCRALDIEWVTRRVDARAEDGQSPEAAARDARYAVVHELLGKDDMLLTAHHQEDQAETVLLQLLRGAGPHGLAAMPEMKPFAGGWLARPLLGFSRAQLHDYARRHQLHWIEDPSNSDTGFERNFLRHVLFPLLEQRHPSLSRVLARSSSHFAEAAGLLDSLANGDLAACRSTTASDALSVKCLLSLEPARCRNLLRYWLRKRHLPLPDSVRLQRIIDECLPAARDANPLIEWPGAQVRRYRDDLHAMPPLTGIPARVALAWQAGTELELGEGLGRLVAKPVTGRGISAALLGQGRMSVRFREGGEVCRPRGRGHHHSLKNLFQEAAVPPWLREHWPLLYCDGEIAAVPGICDCDPFAVSDGEPGINIVWQQTGIEKEE